jgi:non-heme chloroperoxidase
MSENHAAAAAAREGSFRTNDGYTLRYLEAGRGRPVVMIPGWSQTAAQFRGQMELADRYRVLAVDMRGHGRSSKGGHGYRIHRLAKDLHDLMAELDLEEVTLLGHSMGASVAWGYWDLYRDERVSRLVVVDQVPLCAYGPGWPEAEKVRTGGLWDANGLMGTADEIAGPAGEDASAGFLAGMFTPSFPREDLAWVVERNLELPRAQAARLLVNHCMTDWRDLFATITVPTLIVGGRASFFRVEALAWMRDQIPGARLEVFGAEEGGGHFMFMENPRRFNALVREFLG